MNICEGCIKEDVCKFKNKVEKYEEGIDLPEPLTPNIECKYKRTASTQYWTSPNVWVGCGDDITASNTLVGVDGDCYTTGTFGGLN